MSQPMHPRIARQQLAKTRDRAKLLELARRISVELGEPIDELDAMLEQSKNRCRHLETIANSHIDPRHNIKTKRRNQHSPPRRRYYVYLDECGNHAPIDQSGQFPVFCLTAILIDAESVARADRIFRTWKAQHLGAPSNVLHEPELRRGDNYFSSKSPQQRKEIAISLEETVARIDFTCIAAVLDKKAFKDQYGVGKVDDFLPLSTYLLCVDFLMERVIHFLYNVGDDALGIVIAESRGELEDAQVQAEFLRLHLEGTQFVNDSHFRNQLRPYILFRKKSDNDTGLQLADALARPIAESAVSLKPGIIRQSILNGKIYDGQKGRPESYGIKIFPDPVNHPWESRLKANEEPKLPELPTDNCQSITAQQ
ncbi:MAG: DUF3800 domain-containing protein [Thermomicrobiales bacterium]